MKGGILMAETAQLRFNENGKFRILLIADIQDGPVMIPVVRSFLKRIIKDTKPDLIVLGGDNIAGYSCRTGRYEGDRRRVEKAIRCFMPIFEKAGIPTALVFGNHDAECLVPAAEQMDIYASYGCCVAEKGDPALGCGNYRLTIASSRENDRPAFNLWFLDSVFRDENHPGGFVRREQIEWFERTAAQLTEKNGGTPLPSFVFQHIAVNDVYNSFRSVLPGTDHAVYHNGKYYVLSRSKTLSGVMREAPEVSDGNDGFYDACVKEGGVKAMFFAHDHVNSYDIRTLRGIRLIATPGITFGSYGDKDRGSRVITLDENAPDEFETSVLTYTGLFANSPLARLHFRITLRIHDWLEETGKTIKRLKKKFKKK